MWLDADTALRHVDRLNAAALALCGNRPDAEDLVQETFMTLLRRPRRLTGGSELAYLMTMLRNRHIDMHRSAARKQVVPLHETEEPVNGYQVIQQITEHSFGAWRPSPGSVYPTISQLEDEGLVETDDARGQRSLRLTATGATYVDEHADELAAVWVPFQREQAPDGDAFSDLKPEIGQVMGAVWRLVTTGWESQQRAAIDVLVETRRKLYGILADGDVGTDEEAEESETEDES